MARDQRLTKEEIQEDKFVEGILKVYAYLKENLRTIIIVVGVVVVAVAGYAAYHQNRETRRAEAAIALREATEAYGTAAESLFDAEKLGESEESLKTAQTQLREVFEKHPNTVFFRQSALSVCQHTLLSGELRGGTHTISADNCRASTRKSDI